MRDGDPLFTVADYQSRVDRAFTAGVRRVWPLVVIALMAASAGGSIEQGWLPVPLSWAQEIAVPVFLVAIITAAVAWAHLGDREARRLGLTCPGCGVLLLGGAMNTTTTIIAAKGRCLRCKTQVISDPVSPRK